MRVMAVFAVLLLVASCATPQTDQSQAAAGGEKKICKQLKVMGSNMPQRVCQTQAEWDAYEKQGQQTVEEYERAKDAAGQ